jgi:glycosyltransferase involved in cell wall biosynthesis
VTLVDDPKPPLSVVVPVFNGEDTLEACLTGLLSALPKGGEVVVVDDASTDDTAEILGRFPCRCIHHARRLGTSAARNTGWRAALSERIAFVDADVVVRPDSLERLVLALEEEPDVLGANGIFALSKHNGEPFDLVSDFVNTSIHFQHLRHGRRVSSSFTSICVMWRSTLETMGGWDDRLASRYADDVVTRFLLPPQSFVLVEAAQAEHLKRVHVLGLLKHRYNIGYYFVATLRMHRRALPSRLGSLFLHRRYPVGVLSAAGAMTCVAAAPATLGLSLFALPLPAGLLLAGNIAFLRFTASRRGAKAALAALVLCAGESHAMAIGGAAGMVHNLIDRVRNGSSRMAEAET